MRQIVFADRSEKSDFLAIGKKAELFFMSMNLEGNGVLMIDRLRFFPEGKVSL